MSGSDGGGNSTVTQTNLPEYARPYFTELLESSRNTGMQPYTAYQQPRIENFNMDQIAAMTQARSLAIPGQIGDASNRTAFAGDMAVQAAGKYTPGNFDPMYTTSGRFDNDQFNFYRSPYQQNVTDLAVGAVQRNADVQTGLRGLDAAKAGAYGGYRHGIQQSEAERNTASEINKTRTQGLQSNFENAQQQYERDRAADANSQFANQRAFQTAQQMREASNQYGAGLGLSAAQQMQSAAGQLGQLGSMEQQAQLANMGALSASGQAQQTMGQQARDIAYNDFLEQRDWEKTQLQFYNAMLRGGNYGTVTTQTQPAPNQLAQLTGAGLSAAAMYKMMGS